MGSFGTFDHDIMIAILSENVHDERFLTLMRHMLAAGYLEDWELERHAQRGAAGWGGLPVLSNIYLDRVDRVRRDSVDAATHPGKAKNAIRRTTR